MTDANADPMFSPNPPTRPDIQQQRDLEHVKLLSIFYFIYGGLAACGVCLGIFYVFMSFAMRAAAEQETNDQDREAVEFMSTLFIGLGIGMAIISVLGAILIVYAGFCLRRQKHRVYCFIIAGLCCLNVPLGTVLGIFTFIILARPTMPALFKTESSVPHYQ